MFMSVGNGYRLSMTRDEANEFIGDLAIAIRDTKIRKNIAWPYMVKTNTEYRGIIGVLEVEVMQEIREKQ